MFRRVAYLVFLTLGVSAAAIAVVAAAGQAPPALESLRVPQGFHADVFATNVDNARSLAIGAQGTVFVGSLFAGKVYAVTDRDSDHQADRVIVIASGLDQPNGVAIRNGALYVATASAIIAQHGSWNRSTPSGYRVMVAGTDGRRVTGCEPLVEGFLPASGVQGGRGAAAVASGRPSDVLQMPDGSILISDDRGNRLIRVSYTH